MSYTEYCGECWVARRIEILILQLLIWNVESLLMFMKIFWLVELFCIWILNLADFAYFYWIFFDISIWIAI